MPLALPPSVGRFLFSWGVHAPRSCPLLMSRPAPQKRLSCPNAVKPSHRLMFVSELLRTQSPSLSSCSRMEFQTSIVSVHISGEHMLRPLPVAQQTLWTSVLPEVAARNDQPGIFIPLAPLQDPHRAPMQTNIHIPWLSSRSWLCLRISPVFSITPHLIEK